VRFNPAELGSVLKSGLSARLRKFLLVGVVATGVHTLCAYILITKVGTTPALANAISFSLATIVSYVGNTLWSFGARPNPAQLGRFVAVQVLGVILAAVVTGVIDSFGMHYLVGIISVPFVVTPVTFMLHRSWTYQ
jgi:putative flippase GtrA